MIDRTGQNPFPSGTESHEADTQFLQQRQYFRVSPPHGIFALQRCQAAMA